MARSSSPSAHRKPCTLCKTPRDVLIRCQIDRSGQWHMICPGACWTRVSGGVDDGDAAHPDYRYGGMWKNRHADVTAKKPAKIRERQKKMRAGTGKDGRIGQEGGAEENHREGGQEEDGKGDAQDETSGSDDRESVEEGRHPRPEDRHERTKQRQQARQRERDAEPPEPIWD